MAETDLPTALDHQESMHGLAQARAQLPVLLAAVVAARAHEQHQIRTTPTVSNSAAIAQARWSTLQALLTYADAIDALRWPVPRTIQFDIRTHRILCGSIAPAPGARRA